ncbi:MAG: prepilin-type N-terminal cleavage/methylation domain-containing protein [Eubacterium sp.]|nr:prepilin-type N-terminal cleavage/methylation domain-containing protein [Eubacterium sp.]
MNKRRKRNTNQGYTLVELLIIMTIMTILITTVGLSVVRYIEKARIAKDIHNGSLIKNALNVYPFPSDFQGRDVWYEDPVTHEKEHFRRGWVYVD